MNIVKPYCLLNMCKILLFTSPKSPQHLLLLLLGFHTWPLQFSVVAISGLDMFMIKLTEHVNCWKTEKLEWIRICTEFSLFEHQFWQGWVNDISGEKYIFHVLLLNLHVMQTP